MSTEYRDVLDAFQQKGFLIQRFVDFQFENDPSVPHVFRLRKEDYEGKRTLLLRHDIDHDVSYAYDMAKTEVSMGIRSTYYVLTTDSAKKWWDIPERRVSGISMLLEIQDMGHEIGLHYDPLGMLIRGESTDVNEAIETALHSLRTAGLHIAGAAAHGSAAMSKARKLPNTSTYGLEASNLANYHIWHERADSLKVWRTITKRAPVNDKAVLSWEGQELIVPCTRLDKFKLMYEAYSVYYDWYYADDHRGNHCVRTAPPHKLQVEGTEAQNIDKKMIAPGDVMQVLFHPIKWKGRLD